MANASVILGNTRVKFGDTRGDFITDTVGLTWLNQATDELCEILMPLRRLKGEPVEANQESFAVPTDHIVTEIAYHARGLRQPLEYRDPETFFQLKQSIDGAVGDPRVWTEFEGRIYLWPRYGSASSTTTLSLSGTLSTTSTVITIATVGQLRSNGIVRVDSEDVQYTTIGTSGTLGGVIRGYSGTTGAQHATGATVTQLDFQILYRRRPASLAAVTAEPDVPLFLHKKFENYILYLAYFAEGNVDKANFYLDLWRKDLADADYPIAKEQVARTLRVKNRL